MTKRSEGDYGKKCQTFQYKCQMAPENIQCCQGSKYKWCPSYTLKNYFVKFIKYLINLAKYFSKM